MRRLVLLALVLLVATSCSFSRNVRRSSNLMSYLYPNGAEAPPAGSDVALKLPLRLGIAFVPAGGVNSYGDAIAPADVEREMLDVLKKSFSGREWVSQIVTIPSTYLMPGGGFENLDQVARMYNVDVIGLASVDQIQSSDPGRLSFLYLSVVGAYTLPLDHNDTRTLIDVAVFHVPSRTFLLRAPGTSHVEGHSTAVEVGETLREKSVKGLRLAMQDVTKNLDAEVNAFKASVISGERKDVDIVTRSGESVRRSGAFTWLEAAIALLLVAAILLRQ
ncbi:MAG TPA: rhombotarget lipoprotein [Thermoanaerobaculia bacterium]|jgi:rhombotail lipoprotein